MIKVFLLICPMAMSHAQCDQDTALNVVRAMTVPNEQQCMFLGQSMIATSALIPDPKSQYLKVQCLHLPKEASVR